MTGTRLNFIEQVKMAMVTSNQVTPSTALDSGQTLTTAGQQHCCHLEEKVQSTETFTLEAASIQKQPPFSRPSLKSSWPTKMPNTPE